MSGVPTVQRHIRPVAALHGCFSAASPYTVHPSLVAAFYAELLQRGRGFTVPTASLAVRSQPSIVVPSTLVQAAAAASFHSQASRHRATVADDADDDISSNMYICPSPAASDSSASLIQSLSADSKRYHPYEKNV